MTFHDFVELLRARLPVGVVLENPGGGTSTVLSHTETRIYYKRGDSPFHMDYDDLHDAYQRFTGEPVTTSNLKDYAPAIFDQPHGGTTVTARFFCLPWYRWGLPSQFGGAARPVIRSESPFHPTCVNARSRPAQSRSWRIRLTFRLMHWACPSRLTNMRAKSFRCLRRARNSDFACLRTGKLRRSVQPSSCRRQNRHQGHPGTENSHTNYEETKQNGAS
jgi:hypothetical protein